MTLIKFRTGNELEAGAAASAESGSTWNGARCSLEAKPEYFGGRDTCICAAAAGSGGKCCGGLSK